MLNKIIEKMGSLGESQFQRKKATDLINYFFLLQPLKTKRKTVFPNSELFSNLTKPQQMVQTLWNKRHLSELL